MPSDLLTLGFDTSAAHCAAALLSGGRCIAARHEEMAKGQGERLIPLLEGVLAEAGIDWADLDRLGVGIGPGNFTGVRISVAAARGLALGLGVPAVGVSSLEAMALGSSGPVLVCLDARRGEIYAQSFGTAADIGPVLTRADELELSAKGLLCLGHDAEGMASRLGGRSGSAVYPIANAIAQIAQVRSKTDERPAPLYLRGADAAPAREHAPRILP